MVERRKLVELWKRGDAMALATLVSVEGSSYRGAGARILIAADGSHVGSVSGGCLEGEIVRKARWITRSGAAMERYSTLFDDTSDIPYGLGCGGTVNVLMEPADTVEFAAVMESMEASLSGQIRTVTTVLPRTGATFAREILDEQGRLLFRSDCFDSTGHIYTEKLLAPQRLFIFGAGDDAQAMVQLSALLGWSTYVFDGRAQLARAERFPQADAVVAAQQFRGAQPVAGDAVVLMTHSYEQDREWLVQVLPLTPRYLGILGSRHRTALLLRDAAGRLDWPLERVCERVFSPIGLDLGGDGAEVVALSTVAEMQACTQGKLPHSRRMTPELVAEQLERGGSKTAEQYSQSQCAL